MDDADPGTGQGGSPAPLDENTPLEAPPAFPIIGIGASAGGLEAANQLLASLPGDTGMAFVFVQHLDPHHESRVSTILGKSTSMPVVEAQDGMRVEPSRVYIIPPNTTIELNGEALQLLPREQMRTPHLPIDHFLKSLAKVRGSAAIGVILSGTGSDGTLGMEEIKAAGGITFAQDEESAKFPTMPQSAARSGCVDLILPPDGIARELVRIGQHPYVAPRPSSPAPVRDNDDEHYQRILELLRASLGVDFRAYRDTTIRRRIMRRMVLHTVEKLADYIKLLEDDPAELESLYQDILINVTSFFREPEAFDALKQHVFPEILNAKAASAPIRIWVPGCSTGQEAYSLAMVLVEYLEDAKARSPVQIQIFTTDLSDTVSLQKAREGVYPENIKAEITPQRLRRFFTREDGKYRIIKSIRDMCLFAKQNVAADPPFSHVDLISCRNLLIYLAPALQKRVLPTFHYALNSGGFLLLGASETIGSFSDLFTLVDHKHRIYSKKATALRQYPIFNSDEFQFAGGVRRGHSMPITPVDWQREADRLLLNEYAPSGVLVNHEFDILQFRGQTGFYLTPAPGDANFNVLKMAREGLFLELRNALNECREENREIVRRNVYVKGESETRLIHLRVLPVKLPGVSERCFLVLFERATTRLTHESAAATERTTERGQHAGLGARLRRWLATPDQPSGARPSSASERLEQDRIRQELASTRDYLQSVIEQQDAANEELKSANEEILSSNEELQSTNEELETAKEELQSVNEELTTINEQLQNRNIELSRLNDDVANLLSSSNVPMVALSVDLRIRRFTPAAAKLLNLLASDTGRPINNLKLPIEIEDLESVVQEVTELVRPHEREVRSGTGRVFLLRVHPYRTADNRIDGTVIVLQDINEFRIQAEQLRRKVELINLSQDAIFTCDGERHAITFWNRGAQQMYGWSEQEALGKPAHVLLGTVYPASVPNVSDVLRRDGHWEGEVTHMCRDGARICVETRQVWLEGGERGEPEILEINRDVTPRKKLEAELTRYSEELLAADHRKNEFLAVLAHELRNPLAPLSNAAQALRLQDIKASDNPLHDMIERQMRHLTRLVDDLLDVPRITHSRIELRRQQVNLVSALAEVAESLKNQVDAAGEALVVKLPQEPVTVSADPVRLAQVVENLLTNAIKYSDRGGSIELSLERANGEAVVKVKDNGIGIAADMLPHIWDLFAQADRSLERTRGGLGIGLTLVKHLVELHGGRVEAHSEGPGKGTEFRIALPIVATPQTARPAAAPPNTGQTKRRRILIVDDNADAAKSLEILLQLLAHDTTIAYRGEEALELASKFQPDIVLLDIGLPAMNGYEVARRLRANGATSAIIAVSGYGSDEARRRGAEAGFDAHLLKPIDIEELSALIDGFKS